MKRKPKLYPITKQTAEKFSKLCDELRKKIAQRNLALTK